MIKQVSDRVVDLYKPFRNFSYYHPKQEGSASIKEVLPAITGKGYDHLEIGNGEDASLAFFNIVMGQYSEEDKVKIRKNLEGYYSLDTEGMIWIVDELRKSMYLGRII